MRFERIKPDPNLQKLIECYWIVEDEDPTVRQEKIVPDGFTEIIFHAGDPYRIKIDDHWQLQSNSLIAGQISKHFFLENTGVSSIIGVKLKPTTLAHWYGLPMNEFTDKVLTTGSILGMDFTAMECALRNLDKQSEKIALLDNYFLQLSRDKKRSNTSVDFAVDLLECHHGMLPIDEVCQRTGIGERQMENVFRRFVGLTPKFFARILRFNYIFQLLMENNQTWIDLAYAAAYYDQSHFIRNFRNFTGESPGKYAFDKKNMANFFLNRVL